ncbi:MAG: TlpA family protein disulfide reductase [Deltaproteobacteria bacterium]|nr:MAG: TlpA family protein disulfide reductase [Deltaproteobacteria bacterium]
MRRFRRFGTYLIRPTEAVAGPPEAGAARDGWWLTGFYLAAVWSWPLAERLAHLSVTRDLGGLALLAAEVARALLVPILLTVLAEGMWRGLPEAHARLSAVPFVAVVVLAHAAQVFGGVTWPRPYLPEAVGAAVALGYVAFVRRKTSKGTEAPASTAPAPVPSRRRAAAFLALAVTATGVATAVADARRAVGAWQRLRPFGPGDPLPAFSVPRDDGGVLDARDLADGRPTVLVFWATWCGVCRGELPMYERLARAVEAAGGRVVLVLEAKDTPASERLDFARAARARFDLTAPMVVDDGRLFRAVGARVLPHVVVVGGDGRLAAVHEGRVFESTLRRDLEALGLVLPTS